MTGQTTTLETSISPQALMRRIGTPHAPEIIDVCIDPDFKADPHLVPTACRYPHDRILDLAPRLKNSPVVVICQKGKKLSQGAAALLRSEGCDAKALAGGNHAWREAGLPRLPADALPGPLWITSPPATPSTLAAIWLLRRFVNPAARCLWVPDADVAEVADRFNATALPAPGAFRAILDRFALDTTSLRKLADLLGEDEHAHSAEAPGIDALIFGLSRSDMSEDDLQDTGMAIFDAAYQWACAATDTVAQVPA